MENMIMHWSQALSIGLAQCVVSTLWQGTALAALVALGFRVTSRTNASTRFAVWLIAFVVLALLPMGAVAPSLAPTGSAAGLTGSAAQHLHFELDSRWAWAIALLWLCGSLFHATSLVLNGFRLRTLLKTSTLVDEDKVDPQIQAALRLGSQRIQVRLSERVNAPCAVGFFHPAIVIPRWLWAKLTPDELRQIVIHETAHLRRRDDWTNLLQKFTLAVFPLNPALYWIERRLCLEREMACDDAVLATTVSPATYAACLAGLAEKKLLRRTASLAPGAWSRQPELLLRVQGILNRNRNASTRVAGSVAAGFIAVAAGGAFFLARSPQLVSFVTPQPAANSTFKADLVRTDLEAYRDGQTRAAFHQTSFAMPASSTVLAPPFKTGAASHHVVRHPSAHVSVTKPVSQPEIAPAQPSLYQEVGILQSPATGRTWVVLSVWRPAPAQQQTSINSSRNPAIPAASPTPSSAGSAIQTGWLLIRI